MASSSKPTDQRDSELSESERAALDFAKEEHEAQKHRAWLWGVVGKGAKWIAAVVGFTTLVADAGQRLWKAFHG